MCKRVSVVCHVDVRVLVVVHDSVWWFGVPVYVSDNVEECAVSKV